MRQANDDRVFIMQGNLTEEFDLEAVGRDLTHLAEKDGKGIVRVDFSQVRRANSSGLFLWIKKITELDVKVCYVNAPVWLVEQFNMIEDFFAGGALVESIQAPFYDEKDDVLEIVTLELGKDLPILSNYDEYELTIKNANGRKLEPDFDPPSYFLFIADNYESLRKAL